MRGLIMAAIYAGPLLVLGITTKRSKTRRYLRVAVAGQLAPLIVRFFVDGGSGAANPEPVGRVQMGLDRFRPGYTPELRH